MRRRLSAPSWAADKVANDLGAGAGKIHHQMIVLNLDGADNGDGPLIKSIVVNIVGKVVVPIGPCGDGLAGQPFAIIQQFVKVLPQCGGAIFFSSREMKAPSPT